jgi:hypothetical protein
MAVRRMQMRFASIFELLVLENNTEEQACVGFLLGMEIKNPHAMVCMGVQTVTKFLCKSAHALQIHEIRSTIVLWLCSEPSKPSWI